jgi:8-amino-7-oxononanoate synthase
MSNSVREFLERKLVRQEEKGLKRRLTIPSESLIDFSSNDYLGFARSAELSKRIDAEMERIRGGNGSTGSRLLTGNAGYTEETEETLAEFFRADAALILNSGYSANLAVLSSLPQKDDTILYDELAHASLKDGARLSLAKRLSFRHNDIDDLNAKLQKSSGRKFVVVESIYSMDGDESPLEDIVAVAEKHDACVVLDEAHSTGVAGEQGKGIAVAKNLAQRIPVRIYTFGKGMGVHGACVAGSAKLREYMINFARPFIYTTSLSPHSIASIRCSFEHLQSSHGIQEQLKKNIDSFLRNVHSHCRIMSTSAIQTIIVPGNHEVRKAATLLQTKGYDVRAILSPTVPEGAERLRICLHTYNTSTQIEGLCEAIRSIDFGN